MSKKLLQIVVISALVGGIVGSFATSGLANANVFDDFLQFLKKPITAPEMNNMPTAEAPLYKPAIDYEEAVVAAIDKAAPSVVSIVISKDLPVIEECPYDPFADLPPEFRQFFGGGFEFLQPCQKGTQKQEVGGGSGFIVSEDGLVLTNKHVVADTKAEYTVLTNDGEKYDAEVLARDPVQDIAIIKISASGLTSAKLGDSDSIKLGQTAIAIGNALGEFRNTVSVGVISGLSRTITASGEGFGTETIQGVIQTDAAINPGNSGGPLLNLKGEVIGVNTAVVSGAQNIGFAIPVNQAKRDISSVKQTGSIKVPYLGIRYLAIDEGALIQGTEEREGVISDSPAMKAGLKAGDVIFEINGKSVNRDAPLGNHIQRYSIGDTITLKAKRGNETLTLRATLEERLDF